MAGYREHSFDPNAGGSYGPPLRPYNWVQWLGVVFAAVGILVIVAYFLDRAGLVPNRFGDVFPAIMLMGAGSILINSRRQEIPLTPETRRRNTIILGVTLAVCVIVAGLVIVLAGGRG
jgi:hypothetical protein